MIYITGDLHGDIGRFKSRDMRRLRKGDTLIVCGDFGFLWEDSKREQKLLQWIGKQKYQVLFIEGAHDSLELLSRYPQAEWNGGLTREISGRLRYLCRGQVFRVEEKDIFVFGGGECGDFGRNDPEKGYWGGELPTAEEIASAKETLRKHGGKVDYIVTHRASRKIEMFLSMDRHSAHLPDAFFDEVRETVVYKRWFFGSYHINKTIPPSEMALFDAVVPITADTLREPFRRKRPSGARFSRLPAFRICQL